METVNYTFQVPKESKEIIDALAGIVLHFRQGKPIAEAAALLPAVLNAVDGYDKVGEELRSQYNDEAAAYCLHKIFGALKAEA